MNDEKSDYILSNNSFISGIDSNISNILQDE